MKAWLKGGLIGIGVSILLIILNFVTLPLFGYFPLFYICVITFFSNCLPDMRCGMECIILAPLLTIILCFLIGAVIGKIKSKQ
jgi:hypothetical protein